jgi:hypothetical protein
MESRLGSERDRNATVHSRRVQAEKASSATRLGNQEVIMVFRVMSGGAIAALAGAAMLALSSGPSFAFTLSERQVVNADIHDAYWHHWGWHHWGWHHWHHWRHWY